MLLGINFGRWENRGLTEKMKLPLETLEWLFLTSVVYLTVGTIILAYGIASIQLIQITWIWITAAPLFIPMRNIVKINTIWSK